MATAARYKQLNLVQLRTFCEFVRRRSFTDAARALHVSHSAVWQQVRALERRFGVPLLERQGRTWRPTGEGELLLDAISETIRSVDDLEDRFLRLRGDLTRRLTIVATPGTILGELHEPIIRFRKLQPKCYLRVTVSVSMEQATEQLLTGAADLAIASQSIVGQIPLRRSLERTILSTRLPAIAAYPDHKLAKKRRITLADLAAEPLLTPLPSHLWRQRVDDVFRRAGLLERVQYVVEASLTPALLRWAERGLGVALYPEIAGERPEGVVVRSAEHLFPSEELVAVRRRGAVRPEVRAFEQLLAKL
jgi:DNA-binding transcriptional LysR family regulator